MSQSNAESDIFFLAPNFADLIDLPCGSLVEPRSEDSYEKVDSILLQVLLECHRRCLDLETADTQNKL